MESLQVDKEDDPSFEKLRIGARCFHMSIVHLSDLYVFGGKRSVTAKLNDIWKLGLGIKFLELFKK